MTSWRIIEGDCRETMRAMPAASVDAVVCDPPYGLEFMGKDWDRLSGQPGYVERGRITNRPARGGSLSAHAGAGGRGVNSYQAGRPMQEWHEAWALEALRVLKPGGHLLAFGGTRTYHRLTCAIEDAGFEIRDCLAWLYGSGFPKSLDVSKAIDKRPGVAQHAEFAAHLRERIAASGYTNTFDVAEQVVGRRTGAVANWQKYQFPEAKWWPALRDLLGMDGARWDAVIAKADRAKTGERVANLLAVAPGQGEDRSATTLDVTAPATPDAEHWQGWGTALKPAHEPIVLARKPLTGTVAANVLAHGTGALNVDATRIGWGAEGDKSADRKAKGYSDAAKKALGGVVASESATGFSGEVIGADSSSGRWPANVILDPEAAALLDEQTGELHSQNPATRNSPSPRSGVIGFADGGLNYGDSGGASRFFYCPKADTTERNTGLHGQRNSHPTIKPVALMRWLCRLITPPGGTILDPFTGSGTTGIAALREGFAFIGIEREAEYASIARARIIGDAPLINGATEQAA